MKQKMAVLMSSLLATSILTSSIAYADTVSSQINLTIKADKTAEEITSVTVPSVLPIVFENNGSTTTPDNFEVKNLGTTDISIKNIYLSTTDSGWSIHQVENNDNPGDYLLDKGDNYQTIEMLVGEKDKEEKVSIGTISDENRIEDLNINIEHIENPSEDNYSSTTLSFDIYRSSFTESSEVSNAYTLNLEFDFYEKELTSSVLNISKIKTWSTMAKAIYIDANEGDYLYLLDDPDAIDISAEKDRSIVGKDVGDGEYHIVSNGIIYAPEECDYMFSVGGGSTPTTAEIIKFGKNFNTSKVNSMMAMFQGVSKITELDLSNFDFSNVTIMSDMFCDCKNLRSIKFSDNLSGANIENMHGMFFNCQSLETVDLSMFNTPKLTNINGMFNNCKNLTMLNISNLDTRTFKSSTSFTNMTSGCTNLQTIILGDNFGQSKTLPVAGKNSGLFYTSISSTPTIVIGANDVMKSYKWSDDNRIVTFKDSLYDI